MSERYKVVEGSESGHCCFEATVVDTQTPNPMFYNELVCECFGMESAKKIADALNAVHADYQRLQADYLELTQALAESRVNDRQAMYYLNQVREIVGGDDFPDMVERCRELIK